MSAPKLKPCPFCGKEVKPLMPGLTWIVVHKTTCLFWVLQEHYTTTFYLKKHLAAWNRRVK
jgi:hypothetical protein